MPTPWVALPQARPSSSGARTTADAPGRVLIPGEPEAAAERRAEEHGVNLDSGHLEGLVALAERYELPLPKTTPL